MVNNRQRKTTNPALSRCKGLLGAIEGGVLALSSVNVSVRDEMIATEILTNENQASLAGQDHHRGEKNNLDLQQGVSPQLENPKGIVISNKRSTLTDQEGVHLKRKR